MKEASVTRFDIALNELDAWAKRTGQKVPTLAGERIFAETELRAWLDGKEKPLDWIHPVSSPGYPSVTADEWFFITTLYGTMTLAAQRTHIRKFYPVLFRDAAGRDVRNFHAGLTAYAGLRQNWMRMRLIRMGEVLSSRGDTTAEYVARLRELEQTATPSNPTPARDRIFADHQTSSGKTLSVFVRDCVLGNCFPIDSRVRKQLQVFSLPNNNNEEDEQWLVRQCLEAGRNPREVARLFYDAGGTVLDGKSSEMSGDQPPELTDEDEQRLDDVWSRLAVGDKNTQIDVSTRTNGDAADSPGRLNDSWQVFADSDAAYLGWLREHPQGYVVNAYRNKEPNYMVLHRATCKSVSKHANNAKPGAFTERLFIKICSTRISDLSAWTTCNGRQDGSFTGKCSCRPF